MTVTLDATFTDPQRMRLEMTTPDGHAIAVDGGPPEGDGTAADPIDLILAALVCIALTFWQPLLSQWGMMTIPLWTWLENRLYSRRGMGAVG